MATNSIFASAPDETPGIVWVENDHGVLAEITPAAARTFAAELLAAAQYAERPFSIDQDA